MARPTKLTKEKQEKICEAIAKGHTREMAAKMAGVSVDSFYTWMKKGKKAKNGVFRQFYDAVKEADVEAEDFLLQKVVKASDVHWSAAMTILERRWPEKWGRREYIESKTEHTFPLPREISQDDTEQAKKVIEGIADLRKTDGSGDS